MKKVSLFLVVTGIALVSYSVFANEETGSITDRRTGNRIELTCLEMSRGPSSVSCVRVQGRLFSRETGVLVQKSQIGVGVPGADELSTFPRIGKIVEGGVILGVFLPLIATDFKDTAIPLMLVAVPVGFAGGLVAEVALLPATAWTQFVTVPVRKKKLRRALRGEDVRVSHRTFSLFAEGIFGVTL